MRFILPQGIGDSVWALHKIQSVAKGEKIEVFLNCTYANHTESRALDFVKRFKFVDSAQMLQGFSIHPGIWFSLEGYYNYIEDGPTTFENREFYALMPNGPLERGIRLEDWLPQFYINWGICNDFKISSEEKYSAESLKADIGEYATFYLGPLSGNTREGHNRGPIWTPQDWIDLGKLIQRELNLQIVVVGAQYDMDYYLAFLEPELRKQRQDWICLIGQTSIGELYSVTKGSRFVVSYQSGVGIFSSYLGVPVVIFWRPKGNSINPNFYISFEESMSSAWTNPEMIKQGKHMPLIYGRCTPESILEEIGRRKW